MKSKRRVRARRRSQAEQDEDSWLTAESRPSYQTSWWRCSEGTTCGSTLWAWIERLRPFWTQYAIMDLVHEAIYLGRPLGLSRAAQGGQYLLLRSGLLLNLNLIMSLVDTATSRLVKRRAMPVISAKNATWDEKKFATEISPVLRTQLGAGYLDQLWPLLVRDMCIRGDMVAKVVRHCGDLRVRRVPVHELIVDPFEAEHGGPRQLVHLRPEPRDSMIARYPEAAEQIAVAPAYSRSDPWALYNYSYQMSMTHDYVEVAEGWHLPSEHGPDGQHVVFVRGVGEPIYRRRYRRDRFPIAKGSWCAPTRGWRGEGIVVQTAGIQEQVNDILRDAREGLKEGSQLVVFAPRGANINKLHLRGRHPKVVEHDGAEPRYVAPNPVSEQALRILLMLIEQAYQISGISQMNAQSKNTLGANASGKAIDTMDDLQSDRFAYVESSCQQMRVELGRIMVDEARTMALEARGKDRDYDDDRDDDEPEWEEVGPVQDKASLAPWIAKHDWARVELDRGSYHLTLEPVNYLSDTRSGRLSEVAELGKNGMIPDPSIQADLFDEPDIQRANRAILGPKHWLDRVMSGLAKPDIPMIDLQPDQYMNLALGVLMAKGELGELEADETTPEEVKQRFRDWIELARAEIARGSQNAAPSLPGMQPTTMGPAPNAGTLQPGLTGAGPAPGGALPPPGPGVIPGGIG